MNDYDVLIGVLCVNLWILVVNLNCYVVFWVLLYWVFMVMVFNVVSMLVVVCC